MGKISPVSIKYIIRARFEAEGTIEKPDIIGAIFGQTEGLLGDELEMRELQKAGKIGRIEVSLTYSDGKTVGEIEVPTALNKTETSIIGASLETIERVGPSDTKIIVEDIEDVRGSKRDYILDRAKKLLSRFGEEKSDMDEITNEVSDSARLAKLSTYGTENLPCGDVSGDELIIVEGRADVVNLLKKGVKNVIAMNGTKLPETVKELSREKGSVILFVDGDRGGNLIIKNVTENAKIDFIAIAPEGKEVEELANKEILQALRKKVPVSDYRDSSDRRGNGNGSSHHRRDSYENNYRRDSYDRDNRRDSFEREPRRDSYEREQVPVEKKVYTVQKMTGAQKDQVKEVVLELVGTKAAAVFNKDLELIKKVPVARLGSITLDEEPFVIAIDGAATNRVIEQCEMLHCHNLIASTFVSADTSINLVSI